MRSGDLIGTGTLSGPTREELGCLLEMTKNGAEQVELATEQASKEKVIRKFLMDGDTVEFRAKTEHSNGLYSIGFGNCAGTILQSK